MSAREYLQPHFGIIELFHYTDITVDVSGCEITHSSCHAQGIKRLWQLIEKQECPFTPSDFKTMGRLIRGCKQSVREGNGTDFEKGRENPNIKQQAACSFVCAKSLERLDDILEGISTIEKSTFCPDGCKECVKEWHNLLNAVPPVEDLEKIHCFEGEAVPGHLVLQAWQLARKMAVSALLNTNLVATQKLRLPTTYP